MRSSKQHKESRRSPAMSEAYKDSSIVEEQKTVESPISVVLRLGDDSSFQKTIIDIFEGQVRRAPKSVAVEQETWKITYEELNRQANQLGHYLRKLGVGPD